MSRKCSEEQLENVRLFSRCFNQVHVELETILDDLSKKGER